MGGRIKLPHFAFIQRLTNCEAEGKLDPRAGLLVSMKMFISTRRQW